MSPRTLLRRATVPAVLALALSLSACSSADGSKSAGATPPPASAPASDGGSYPGTAELLVAMNANGLPCEEPEKGTYPGVSDAQSCILDGAEDVSLLHFATPEERQQYVSTRDALASAALGQNWAVETVLPQTAEKVVAAIGGELVKGETV